MNAFADGDMKANPQVFPAPDFNEGLAFQDGKRLAPPLGNSTLPPKLSNGQAPVEPARPFARSPSPTKEPRDPSRPRANILELLASSYQHKQQPQDAGTMSPANGVPLQRRAVQFPTLPMEVRPEMYGKLEEDTLFFIFYYQQGTKEQLLAAKELKRRDWVFHMKHRSWFQHYEVPKVATAEKEEGAFVYFDFESGWCKKIKKEFTLVLQYVETENVP